MELLPYVYLSQSSQCWTIKEMTDGLVSEIVFERYLKVGLGKQFFVGVKVSNWLIEKGWR